MNLKLENFINKGMANSVLQFLKLLSTHESQQKFLQPLKVKICFGNVICDWFFLIKIEDSILLFMLKCIVVFILHIYTYIYLLHQNVGHRKNRICFIFWGINCVLLMSWAIR